MNTFTKYTSIASIAFSAGYGLSSQFINPNPVKEIIKEIQIDTVFVPIKEVVDPILDPVIKPIKKKKKLPIPLNLDLLDNVVPLSIVDKVDDLSYTHIPEAFKIIPDAPNPLNVLGSVGNYRPMIYRAIFDTTLSKRQRWTAVGFAAGELVITAGLSYLIFKPNLKMK